MTTFKENLAEMSSIESLDRIVLFSSTGERAEIPNENGKRGSLQLYNHVLLGEDGTIGAEEAKKALELFAEHTEDAKLNPGNHPNIDRLFPIAEGQATLKAVLQYKLPSDLQERVQKFHELKVAGKLMTEKNRALVTFHQVMDLLEKGHLRTAEFTGDGWRVNSWVKQGIMLGFPLGDVKVYNDSPGMFPEGHDVIFTDKETFPLRKVRKDEGFRVVPPAAGLRRGAYAGRGCTFMPPAYVNIGGHVGRGSMVESLVGSCAQVGRDCHISSGSVIGGVLDPIEAAPVILGDNVLLGEGAGVTQGTRLGDLVTLAPGTHISKATPVLDPVRGKAYTAQGTHRLEDFVLYTDENFADQRAMLRIYSVGELLEKKDNSYGPEIPAGALVIPGMSPASIGGFKVTPMIVKYIGAKPERAYALEEALRG